MTADNANENDLQMKFDNWVSGTNTLATNWNVKMVVSAWGSTSLSEATIAAWKDIKTTYDETNSISGLDNNPNKAGKQFVVDVFVKLPQGTAGGAYSSSYVIENN